MWMRGLVFDSGFEIRDVSGTLSEHLDTTCSCTRCRRALCPCSPCLGQTEPQILRSYDQNPITRCAADPQHSLLHCHAQWYQSLSRSMVWCSFQWLSWKSESSLCPKAPCCIFLSRQPKFGKARKCHFHHSRFSLDLYTSLELWDVLWLRSRHQTVAVHRSIPSQSHQSSVGIGRIVG
jgi:hypothetical protein